MSDLTLADWQQRAAELSIEGRAFINGEYVNALSGKTTADINPANGQKLADIACCGPEDAELAIAGARKAYQSGVWSKLPPAERKKVIVRWANLLEEHQQELALLESLDCGKPISDTLYVDSASAINTLRWNGEAVDKVYDEIAPTGPGELGLVTRMPLGVVVAIVPWNFPLATTAWKLGPSLATGNSVILKPASNTPLTALRLAGLAKEAGLPDGVLQVLPGPGGSLGEALSLHMDIDGQTFTGSTPVGKMLMEYSAKSNLKRTFLELGGKSPNIVFADADLDKAAKMAALAIFYNQGETCTAGSRLLVEESIIDEFVAKVAEAAKGHMPGNPLDPNTVMGALIDKKQFDTVEYYVDVATKEGAELVCGGKPAQVVEGGYYYEPTIFKGVRNNMQIAQEEVFGPVLVAIPFKDEADAVAIANDSIYGLACGIWTNNLGRAHRVAAEIEAGSVWVNNYFGGDITVPFGGFKQSGNGRDKSLHAFDDYTELKSTWIDIS
ncbi:aldehyde dehydrogenase [Dasania sp. GY-MA-18]|uniref:Aldehyde dehydrogenase n=1 Tax=Dasania phycosphaerae TaxID=2950436 RepID=A0A9J6RH73_9GAMM|nr:MULTISPECIES: aldehyde dehydrogenase [Dasania]MCR8921204.1 aldehyde dehydrogenase [Dasania sp. GY-MA-18]MCZ0863632.1 aldehyde dehydrogenase [Dasania phycosphaerae]MCZ0867360.1 aldehyde dehydrogenase [Dasania phycosphaerae]